MGEGRENRNMRGRRELRIPIRHCDRAAAAPAAAASDACYKFSAAFLGGVGGGRLKLTFAEEDGGGGRKVKRIVVDALAKRESSLSASAGDGDVTVYAGRAAAVAGRVVTGADEAAADNEAVNRNDEEDDGAAFVIFDRGERTVVHIRPPSYGGC